MKSEQEDQELLKAEEEERLVEDARQEEKGHQHAQPKAEEGVCLALEARWRVKSHNCIQLRVPVEHF